MRVELVGVLYVFLVCFVYGAGRFRVLETVLCLVYKEDEIQSHSLGLAHAIDSLFCRRLYQGSYGWGDLILILPISRPIFL